MRWTPVEPVWSQASKLWVRSHPVSDRQGEPLDPPVHADVVNSDAALGQLTVSERIDATGRHAAAPCPAVERAAEVSRLSLGKLNHATDQPSRLRWPLRSSFGALHHAVRGCHHAQESRGPPRRPPRRTAD
jgi:hypothetical protein